GETCHLIRPKNQSISDWIASASGSLLDGIIAICPKRRRLRVSVPLFTVETPMRLARAASMARGRFSLWRLFDREKCKLTRIFYSNSDDSLCTLPLWTTTIRPYSSSLQSCRRPGHPKGTTTTIRRRCPKRILRGWRVARIGRRSRSNTSWKTALTECGRRKSSPQRLPRRRDEVTWRASSPSTRHFSSS
ncbi:hypothetical protein PENTCL1PPCAC_30333, partial [Pristionchus entomophagus]